MASTQKIIPQCSSCKNEVCEKDVDLVEDIQFSALEKLHKSSNTLKHNNVHIAEFLVHKYELAAQSFEYIKSAVVWKR